MKNFNKYIPVIIVVLIIIAGVYYFEPGIFDKLFSAKTSSKVTDSAMKYINEVLLGGESQAVLISVSNEGSVYKLKIKIDSEEYDSYVSKDGRFLFPQGYEINVKTNPIPSASTIGDFTVSKDEACKENGKPIVYFFGSETCPHCQWEKPILEKVVAEFKDMISFHENIDNKNDEQIFSKYSDGPVPTLVLGCKYYRVGSGEQDGEKTESQNLTALICKLTGNQPGDVCDKVKELINQIKD